MPPLYRFLRWLMLGLLRGLTRFDLAGVENVPATGALIVAPNHIYTLDVVVVFAGVPRRMIAFAGEHWRGTPAGWLLQVVANAIFVQRGAVDRRALGEALAVLQAGGALGVAPEGTRSPSGALIPGKSGVAYLAARSGAWILPVAAWGQETIFRSWLRLRRPEVHVHIGPALRLPPAAAHARTADLAEYTDQIMLALARLLPPAYRGVYAARVEESG